MPLSHFPLLFQRQYLAHFYCTMLICIFLELLIILHLLQLFKNTIENAKSGPITWEWQVSFQPTNCSYRVNWYRFYVTECDVLKIGEEYQLIGSLSQSTDTLFFKQISLNIQEKRQLQTRDGSVKAWFGFFYQLRSAARSKITSQLEEHLPRNTAALVSGLLLGDDSGFTEDTREKLAATGLQHLTAASGYNLSLVVGAVSPLLHLIWKRRSNTWVLLCFVWSFIFFAQAGASLLRAGMALTVASLAKVWFRSSQAWWSTTMGIFILTIVLPHLWWDISFQLSVAATAGILLLSDVSRSSVMGQWVGFPSGNSLEPAPRVSESIWSYLKETSFLSLAALSLVTPLLLLHFQEVAGLGVVSSLAVIWLIPAASLAAAGSMLLSLVLPADSLAWSLTAALLTWPLELILKIISYLSQGGQHLVWSIPWSNARVGGCWAAVVSFYLWRSRRKARVPAWR